MNREEKKVIPHYFPSYSGFFKSFHFHDKQFYLLQVFAFHCIFHPETTEILRWTYIHKIRFIPSPVYSSFDVMQNLELVSLFRFLCSLAIRHFGLCTCFILSSQTHYFTLISH